VVWAVSLSTTKLSPRRLTHPPGSLAFAVWLGLVTSTWPRAHPALYLQCPPRVAAPQCISGRTSYLHVRLAFHPYPQVIPQFCNTGGCEPRRTFTSASLCSWVAHVVSGRLVATLRGSRPLALFRLGFPLAPPRCRGLTCNDDTLAGSFYKRHAISPLVAPATVASDCLHVRGFRVSFIPLSGCFSPFPHGTRSLSVASPL
jgi:hypothetical protein